MRSTRCGRAISPLLATAAATIAICSGVAVVSNCPIEESASWSGLISRSKVDLATHDGTRSAVSLKPNRSTASTIPVRPTSTPSPAITVLHDHWRAYARDASPQPSASFGSTCRVPGSTNGSGVSVGASTSRTTPASRAAAAVTILNVEPGGYVCRSARFSIGRPGAEFSRSQASLTPGPVPESTPGSYEGELTSARIRPVAGSTATIAPRFPASPRKAVSCIEALIVVTTSPPGSRPRVRPFRSGSGASIGSVPARTASSASSTSVVP